jgi:3-oxoacyl-[acyl-carrier-protein] synthase-3
LKHIIHTADNIKAFSDLSRQLGIAIDCTNEDISMEYGHLGAADQIFGLEKKLSSGKLGKGDVVALTSVGSGMHWTCTLLQI